MIRIAFAAALLAATSPLAAQTIPSPDRIAALRDAALADTYAWDIIEGLTTEVGQSGAIASECCGMDGGAGRAIRWDRGAETSPAALTP